MIDVRTALQFDEAHIPGAICNTILQSGFGTRLAWIAGPDHGGRARRPRRRRRAARRRAGRGGRRRADRRLPRGRDDELARGAAAGRVDRAAHRAELHERADALQILDVRERDEWEAGHIPGSVFAPYHDIHALPGGPRPGAAVAVICASGQRAAVGASLVQRFGAPRGLARGRRRRRRVGARAGLGAISALASTHGSPTPARPSRRLGYDAAPGLRRGRALPPDVHDAAALVGRDAAARARAVARGDELEPALARARHGDARPRRVPVRAAAAAGVDLEGAR